MKTDFLDTFVSLSQSYLSSEKALHDIERNTYWPKWDTPWWHMQLLHELDRHDAIPKSASDALSRAVEKFPFRALLIRREDAPPDISAYDAFCPCMLGTLIPMLAKCGVDIDAMFSWVRDWFARYQMSDGGLSCDSDAYLVTDEIASSMVGTVSPLEAMLAFDKVRSDETSRTFLDNAAKFLILRRLTDGSPSRHNAEERDDERHWLKISFPRFYFYDVFRGLDALTAWAEHRNKPIPRSSFAHVYSHLETSYPEGSIRISRQPWANKSTVLPSDSGWPTPVPRAPARHFPLLDTAGQLGIESEVLSVRWAQVKERISRLEEKGLVL